MEIPKTSNKWRFTDSTGIDCPVCGTHFVRSSGVHKFCSAQCKGKWKYITGTYSTENQYKMISGNWQRYFCRLMRRTTKRPVLTVKDLHEKLAEQKGLCALSGVPLTCTLEQGKKFKTNASIDRIRAGEEYTKDNIQLVCAALNSWRGDTDLQEFIWFCKKVTEYQEGKEQSSSCLT
jgi:hypothetical protein